MTTRIGALNWRMLWVALVFLALNATAYAQNTTMSIVSEPGDYIGQGQTIVSNAVLVDLPFPNGTVQIYAGVAPDRFYSVTLSVSESLPILPGVYETSSGFGWPKISVSGDGRGCSGVGRFEILDAAFDANGRATRFSANFEYHCGGFDKPGLFGQIRVVGPPPPRLQIDFDIDQDIALNRVTGRAVVSGTVRCSQPTTLQYAALYLSQEVQHFPPLFGAAYLQGIECSKQGRRITAEIQPEFNSPTPPGFGFRRGEANVSIYAYARDPNYFWEQYYIADHPIILVIDND